MIRKKQPNTLLILLNGELRAPEQVRRIAQSGAIVLCTDGGARHAAALKIQPRVIIGDMDSLPKKLPHWKTAVYLCDFDENISDFEKALRFAARRGFRRIKTGKLQTVYVAGAVGGRLDHSMVNIALFEKYSKTLPLTLLDDSTAQILEPGNHFISCRKGQHLTLLPVTEKARVTASGLYYPLQHAVLERSSRGLSNRATSGKVRIQIHRGRCWVILCFPIPKSL